MIEAEVVTRGRTGKRVAAAVRSGRTALRGKSTAAVGRPGLKTARRHVNGSNREGWRRRWGKRSGHGDGGCGRPGGVMEEIRRGGQISRQQFTTVRQRRPHGVGQTAEVNGVEEDICVLREEGVHFGEKCRWPTVTKRGHVQNSEAPLQRRGGEAGEQCILNEEIWVRGGGGDHPSEVPDGGEDLRRKGPNDMDVTNV